MSKPGPSTKQYLDIAEIREDVVIMKDGTVRAVLLASSINFALKSEEEQNAIISGYVQFLNGLDFPLQVIIQSRRLNIEKYLDKLKDQEKKQANELLKMQIADYRQFVGELISLGDIMSKKFYVVIGYPDANVDIRRALKASTGFFTGLADLFGGTKTPHIVINESTLQNAKTELTNRIQACMQGLLQCGVQSVPLDTQELIELYYDAYNPDTATRQQLTNADDLTAEVVQKGAGQAPSPNLDRQIS